MSRDTNAAASELCVRAAGRFERGDLSGAEQDLREALRLAPSHPQALYSFGVLRERQGRPAEARELYDKVLQAEPKSFGARLNRGALRLDAGDAEGALEDFDAIAAPDALAEVHTNRARALFALFRDGEALEAAEAALRVRPQDPRALMDRGLALACLGRLDEAEPVLAPLRRPEHRDRLDPAAIRFSRLLQRQSVCDWAERDVLVAMARAAMRDPAGSAALGEAGVLLGSSGLPLTANELLSLGTRAMAAARKEGARIAARLPPLDAGPRTGPIRVGIFGSGLRLHPEAHLVRRLLTDRGPGFEHFLYALNPDDGSALRSELARTASRFVDVSSWTSEAIARLARADRLDIALDLSGTFEQARPELFAARVAPVQAAYIATPSTLGPGIHDYRISDPWTTPAAEQVNWAERLVLVPAPAYTYDDSTRTTGAGTRSEHGLPEQGFVFCCMNQAFKIEPEAFACWMRLLRAVPGSVLWLLDPGNVARRNLLREAGAAGVAAERLVFAARVPMESHLGRLAHADLFLDTFRCNAHTTALDALWAGVPVLTLTGETMASRLATTFVRAAGLDDLVAATPAGYEAKARALALAPARAQAWKAAVAQSRRSALFDTGARVRAVENAIAAMVQRHRAGLAPETLVPG